MPYDQFVRAQLAGDLLADDTTRARTLPALGFLGLGPWFYDNGAVEITRADERHDRVDVVSRGFLGLTVGCARCHDHKYDPIPTTDYYSLAGVFLNTSYKEYPLVPKSVADEFQAQLLDVMFDKKEIKEENDIIAAKALPGTKKKEPGKLPSDFVTNDDFCPGCGLELKSLPIERNNLWTDVFVRDLQEGFDPAQMFDRIKPGLLAFRGWGLERQLSGDRRRYIDGLRTDIEKLRKEQPPKYPFVHGVGDVEKPVNLKVSKRGSPYNLGDEAPRHFLSVLSDAAPAAFHKGSGRLELADAIVQQPITIRVIVNRIWKGHFGSGIVDTPSNFGTNG